VSVQLQLELLKSIVIDTASSVVALRRAVNILANQPTLLLSPAQKVEISKELEESRNRTDKLLNLIEKLLKTSND
jgi:uncharacterized protein (DUF1778 family)